MDQFEIPTLPPRGPLQFGLKTILAIVSAFAGLFAAGSWFGLIGYVGFFLLAALAAIIAVPQLRTVEVFVLYLVAFVVAAGLLSGTFVAPRAAMQRSQCISNLKRIGLGLQNYADAYGCFPPAHVTDKEGKPLHSWRVLILPFIEQKALYDRYDFSEPWDGPHNSLLAKAMPPCFRCPNDAGNNGQTTSYVAIVGVETLWQADRGTTFTEVTDGATMTLAVVEAVGAKIPWMAPQDLPFSATANGINSKQGLGMSSGHPGGVCAVFADGHTQILEQTLPVELLRALCTKAGGETINGEF